MAVSNNDTTWQRFSGDSTGQIVLPCVAQRLLRCAGKPVFCGDQPVESVPLVGDGHRVVFGVCQACTFPSVAAHQGGARGPGAGGFNQPALSVATVAHDAAIAWMVRDQSIAFIVFAPLASLVGLLDPGDSTEVVETAAKVGAIGQLDSARVSVSEFDGPMPCRVCRLDGPGSVRVQVTRRLSREVGQQQTLQNAEVVVFEIEFGRADVGTEQGRAAQPLFLWIAVFHPCCLATRIDVLGEQTVLKGQSFDHTVGVLGIETGMELGELDAV